MSEQRDAFVSKLLDRMSLAEKVGQCFTLSWRGNLITPSIMDVIEKLHVGGLRVEPYTTESAVATYYGRKLSDPNFVPPPDYFSIAQTYFQPKHPGTYTPPDEYARRLNRLQELAMARPSGVPLHITLDYEGDFSHDYPFGGIAMFPSQMGLTACGDDDLVYRVGKAVAAQLRAVGITMVHSPVCDVNVNPDNPEIGTRAFSDKADVCARAAVRLFEGIRDGGLVATAKHFPGRGDSSKDAHEELESIAVDHDTLFARELLPYQKLIDAGIGAIMSAHSAYPSLDSPDTPATLSSKIIRGVLREQLGFTGVITTDAMGMGAIVKRWGIPRACVLALKAGCNLMLVKNDEEVRTQSFFAVKQAVEKGELSEEELNDSVRYVLNMKYDQGLFENGAQADSSSAATTVGAAEYHSLARTAAERGMVVLRDRDGLLPLSTDSKVLVIEQITPLEFTPNDVHCNSHVLNEAMLEHSRAVINATSEFQATDREAELLLDVAGEADVVVVTNFYWRIRPQNNAELVARLCAAGKKVVVLTNTPYAVGAPEAAGTVVCLFGAVPESLRAGARLLYGKAAAKGTVPIG
ncbi:MAG: hypothetical protein GF331_08805 [Chitinivibrionales bacterium]|nr:hypothetical protein [Chitinivibrionales bacterium]